MSTCLEVIGSILASFTPVSRAREKNKAVLDFNVNAEPKSPKEKIIEHLQ